MRLLRTLSSELIDGFFIALGTIELIARSLLLQFYYHLIAHCDVFPLREAKHVILLFPSLPRDLMTLSNYYTDTISTRGRRAEPEHKNNFIIETQRVDFN